MRSGRVPKKFEQSKFKLGIGISVLFISSCFLNVSNAYNLNRFSTIQYLANAEDRVFELAKAEIERYEQELVALKGYVKDYQESTQRHLDGLKENATAKNEDGGEHAYKLKVVASNPLLIYRLSHRFSTKFSRMQKALLRKNKNGSELRALLAAFADPNDESFKDLEEYAGGLGIFHEYIPNHTDLEDTLESLAILYDTFEPLVTPYDFATKISPETTTPLVFDAAHSLKVSLKAFYHGLYASALDWISYSIDRVNKHKDDSVPRDLVHYTKEFMMKTHNNELNRSVGNLSTRTYLAYFETPVSDDTLKNRRRQRTRREALRLSYEVDPDTFAADKHNESKLVALHNSLCKGNHITPQKYREDLKCHLDAQRHPFYILNPLKVEELSSSPTIYQVYDFLTHGEVEAVLGEIDQVTLETDTARTYFPDINGTRNAPNTTSVSLKFDMKDYISFKALAKKAEFLTGLTLKGNGLEKDKGGVDGSFRITEYVGGRYGALRKDIDMEQKRTGSKDAIMEGDDIMSTILFYLTSVDNGGETVFPIAEVVGRPVKGSVLYWENLYKSGKGRDDVWFGDCPVSRGLKIVASKSFHFFEQQNRLKCPLESN